MGGHLLNTSERRGLVGILSLMNTPSNSGYTASKIVFDATLARGRSEIGIRIVPGVKEVNVLSLALYLDDCMMNLRRRTDIFVSFIPS